MNVFLSVFFIINFLCKNKIDNIMSEFMLKTFFFISLCIVKSIKSSHFSQSCMYLYTTFIHIHLFAQMSYNEGYLYITLYILYTVYIYVEILEIYYNNNK